MKNFCYEDHWVYDAASLAFNNVGLSSVAVLQTLIDGYIALYRKSNCDCCSDKQNAELFGEIISTAGALNALIPPGTTPVVGSEAYFAQLGLATLNVIVGYYVNLPCICNKGKETRKRLAEIFFKAIRNLNHFGIVGSTVNLTLITAAAHYLALEFCYDPIPIFVPPPI
jgi:hypothetical protein